MIETLGHYAWKAVAKLGEILQTLCGWCYLIALFLLDYFSGHGFIVGLAVFVTLMDAVWGIAVSVKQGKFTLSELARLTIAKLAVYGCALSVFVGLDKVTDSVITGSLVGAAIVLVEFWSCCASMLILFPYMPFLKLMKKALTGEIASKLHIEECDVEDVLRIDYNSRKAKREDETNDNI
jgi:hypothetical protein